MIDVVHRPGTDSSDGSFQFGLDLNEVPVPSRRYIADVGCVVQSRGEVKLIFGQERIGTSSLRSMLIVQMSELGAKQCLQSFVAMSPSLTDIAGTVGVESEKLSVDLVEPDQAVSFAANFVAAAIVGAEACLDFYHASPFALRSVHLSKKLSVEPVVRVDIRLSLLMAMIDELERIESQANVAA
ncbi:hypothetical protein EVC45_10420 [Paraburkholderia sp. UYCP14C]|uniref:hypothetical protein n=1 Tax=Paraburkholderia sp. UYCP14C TaxID=2511130 RepID=UPI001020C6F2|nr:hypothetical protein [Paraburkholderia sp. UYCP14C]RZF29999.1 hypothetical protein EVC45_10420 [Paraburkholderia sp. UYCP14C]